MKKNNHNTQQQQHVNATLKAAILFDFILTQTNKKRICMKKFKKKLNERNKLCTLITKLTKKFD